MKTRTKQDTVEVLRRSIGSQNGAVVAEFKGLTVAEMTVLRKKLRDVNAEFRVVKNTLMRLAAKDLDFARLNEHFNGPTAVALTHGDPIALAKAMKDYAATSPKIRLKAGLFEGKVLGAKEIESLAEVPPRPVLLGRLAGGLASSLVRLAGVLSGPQRKLAYALQAVHDQRSAQPTT